MRRLLFVTCEENIDYENDSVFHGLCSLPDTEVSILNETCFDYMFKGFGVEQSIFISIAAFVSAVKTCKMQFL